MHPRSRRPTILATAALALTFAACSSSTSPKSPSPQSLATHYDSIYSALVAAGTSADSEVATLVAIATVLPPAYGSPQSTFTVTTASGTATWKGYTLETAAANADSSFLTVAFSDNNLSQVIFAESDYDAAGPVAGGAVALVGLSLSTGGDDSTFTGSATVASVGHACPALQSGLASAPVLASLTDQVTACAHATFNVSFSATFFASENLGALSSISISNATFDGVQLSGALIGPSHVAPGPSRLAALMLRLRNLRAAHAVR
jgi:hypothetical protein